MRIILILASLYLTACGSAWVVERRSDRGIIGYQGYTSGTEATKEIKKLIPCPYYEAVSDRIVNGGTKTIYMPQTNTNNFSGSTSNQYGNKTGGFSGSYDQTNYVPMQVNNSWREFEYRCINNNAVNIPEEQPKTAREYSPAEMKAACQADCQAMEAKKELKSTESFASCMKMLCN